MSVVGNSFDVDDPLPEPRIGGYVDFGVPVNATFDEIAAVVRQRRASGELPALTIEEDEKKSA